MPLAARFQSRTVIVTAAHPLRRMGEADGGLTAQTGLPPFVAR